MSKQVLVEIFHTYGKQDGEELRHSEVIEDTVENRQAIINEWNGDESFEDEDNFINQIDDSISYGLYGGDWDDPTGRDIIISSYESKLEKIQSQYEKDIEELNKLFKK